jgi:putative endonuclease
MGLNQDRGRAGETIAAAYLALLGWPAIQRNQDVGGVEVDLLAQDGRTRVIVEVKFRGRTDYGGAAAAVDRSKRERLLRAAAWLAARGAPVRIDAITIDLDGDGLRLRHIPNAVTA